MQKLERNIVLWSMAYWPLYIPFFAYYCSREMGVFPEESFYYVITPLHLFGMALTYFAIGLTLRDIYKRPFSQLNDRQWWAKLIIVTGGIAYVPYYFKHGRKPR